ncbi:SusC/RagA family TonB-linked outer membrane protein [Algoriphagus zhangzhouensis]|uniref:TonB-linked outer membrane protein, SusC/RagA family n=1 Tax=Algoriphagus zhangzhouensis TaxID=1073327 RepID=A0A1M7Z7G6_9BACT|nr:SusC/RagA family TonB-linked outer membrane protein [Algoriphagus zhangzhouensis]TDY49347.1 TonB-linked SusC/RagA family outer membrane protein [Algoriphagus zhangzhouensis]SHO60805.1 TonB-linked outer membrane protein, SusC/RagA family [Algoriphagus zhangzhouensis]
MRKVLSITFTLVMLICVVNLTQAQTRVVKGVVTASPDGLPMPGVTILDKSNQTGTTTNVDGEYSITVGPNSILVFSFIGYSSQEVTVGNQSEININLEEDASELSEVVVTALGISKEKEKLGYSLTEVGSETMTKARETNVANSLAGRVAGLVVKGTNSGPGGTSKITLRGTPSINGTGSPLYVINGVPMDNTQRGSAGQWGGSDNGDGIGNLSPDDIETMTVLKGQAASALYGTRASNGVILITTKSGKKGGEWSASYNLNYMVENPVDFTDFQNQYGQGTGGQRPTTATDAQTTGRLAWGELMGGSVIGFDGNQYPYEPTSDTYLDFYRTGSNFTNTVSVSKGLGTDGSFRMSVSNLDSKSIVPNSGMDRLSLNLNVDQNITDKLNVTAMVNYIDQKSTNIPFLSDGPKNPNNFLFLAPNISQSIFAPGYNADTGAETVFSDDIYVTNPYFIVNQGINDLGRKRTISALSTKYSFTENIYAMVRIGNDVSNDDFYSIDPYGLAYSANLQGNLNSRGQSARSELNIDGIFGAKVDLTEGLVLDALIGGNIRKNKYERVSVGGSRFVLPYLYSPFNVEAFSRGYSYSQLEVHSGFYSLDFGIKEFLTLSTTGRYDVYSTLTSPVSDDNSIFSPSVSMAFLFDQFLNIPAMDFGKLRASYAVTSGDPGVAYSNQFYYSSANSFAGVPAGSSPTSLPNLFLKPFTTDEIEIGLDMNFFNNRLGLDMAYYTKTTHNEIMNASLSIASGFSSAVVATGSIQNKGLEVLLTGKPIQTADFTWTSSFNLTKVKNEVLSTDENNNPVNLGQNRATLGNAVTAYVVGEAGPQIRAYDYQYNADGSIVVDEAGLPVRGDLINMGTVLPTLYGGWNNEFNYKGVSFSFLIDYNYGNKVLSATEFYSTFRGLNQVTLEGRESGVTNSGVTASAEDYYKALAQNITSTSVVDGDFIKLRQMTLGYSLPASWFGNTPVIKGLDISFVARNLAILMRKAKNIDPEASFGSNINYTGIEGTSLPSTRSFGFNLNFKLN